MGGWTGGGGGEEGGSEKLAPRGVFERPSVRIIKGSPFFLPASEPGGMFAVQAAAVRRASVKRRQRNGGS